MGEPAGADGSGPHHEETAGRPPLFDLLPVPRTPRLSDLVSERLLDSIREARLPPGARLPSERELGERFGVSRTVVREAVRHLAAKGILDVRSGSGVRVADLDGSGVSDSIGLFLRRRGLPDPAKINEVREALELETTRLAAERATEEHQQAIRAAYEEMRTASDPEVVAQADVAFHRAIAAAAENELYVVLVDSLRDVLTEIRRATVRQPGRADAALREHGRVLEALERRNAPAAVAAMRDHLATSYLAFRHAVDP